MYAEEASCHRYTPSRDAFILCNWDTISLRRRESKWKGLKNFIAGAKVIWAALWGMSCWIVGCQSQFPEDKASLHVNYLCSFSSKAGLTTFFSFLKIHLRALSTSKSTSVLLGPLTGGWVQNSLTSFYPSYQAEAARGWVIGSQDSQARWIQGISDELKRPVLLEWTREQCTGRKWGWAKLSLFVYLHI